MAVAQSKDKKQIRFLYELKEGPANESFGIQVASMAGLPSTLIRRSWAILRQLENGSPPSEQMNLFTTPCVEPEEPLEPEFPGLTQERRDFLENLDDLNLNEMTPIEAMQVLSDFQKTRN